MQITTVDGLQAYRSPWTGSVGFVPTMGALHEGHSALIQHAKHHCDQVIVSIFVNPKQFAPHEDFNQYPRPIQKDLDVCHELGVSAIFTPTVDEIYPPKPRSSDIYTPNHELATIMCGKSRPHFFYGVCQVVQRLFHIVQPTHAFFGDKDLQQQVIIRRMVQDLNLPILIVGAPTIRDANGLALSSRNQYLSSEQYDRALVLFKTLHDTANLTKENNWTSYQIRQFVASQLEARGLKGDYVEIFRPSDGTIVNGHVQPHDHCCVAAYCDTIRLIDNVQLLSHIG